MSEKEGRMGGSVHLGWVSWWTITFTRCAGKSQKQRSGSDCTPFLELIHVSFIHRCLIYRQITSGSASKHLQTQIYCELQYDCALANKITWFDM